MKKIGRISLTNQNCNALSNRELGALRGGGCGCTCCLPTYDTSSVRSSSSDRTGTYTEDGAYIKCRCSCACGDCGDGSSLVSRTTSVASGDS